MYPPDQLQLPPNYMPEYPFKDAIGCGKGLRDERLAPWPRTPFAVRTHRSEYYALITHTDQMIGKILKKLNQTGLRDNTVIIMSADNGLAVGSHGLMGKQNMFEHSLRVPLIMTGPGIPRARVVETPVYMFDLMPTTLQLAGLEIPSWIEYRSLIPLLNGSNAWPHGVLYAAYQEASQRMIRKGKWKLIYYPKIERWLLFDLDNDPWELNDLATRDEYKPILISLINEFKMIQRRLNDPLVRKQNP